MSAVSTLGLQSTKPLLARRCRYISDVHLEIKFVYSIYLILTMCFCFCVFSQSHYATFHPDSKPRDDGRKTNDQSMQTLIMMIISLRLVSKLDISF